MKHKWHPLSFYGQKTGMWRCKVCGCRRSREVTFKDSKPYTYYFYDRSGIEFGMQAPECINWDEENNKTID